MAAPSYPVDADTDLAHVGAWCTYELPNLPPYFCTELPECLNWGGGSILPYHPKRSSANLMLSFKCLRPLFHPTQSPMPCTNGSKESLTTVHTIQSTSKALLPTSQHVLVPAIRPKFPLRLVRHTTDQKYPKTLEIPLLPEPIRLS